MEFEAKPHIPNEPTKTSQQLLSKQNTKHKTQKKTYQKMICLLKIHVKHISVMANIKPVRLFSFSCAVDDSFL